MESNIRPADNTVLDESEGDCNLVNIKGGIEITENLENANTEE